MGTTFTVKVVHDVPSDVRREARRRLIEAEFNRVDQQMSHYREESELSRFNRARHTDPFPVSLETFTVFQQARALSVLTDGAFDVTIGPLVDAWGFGVSTQPEHAPSASRIAQLMAHLGHDKIDLDEEALTLRKRDPLVEGDLSAIAKGYAVDRVAEALEAHGISRYMIEVGGEVRTAGANETGEPWRLAIGRPIADLGAIHRVIPLSGLAMATSGDYRNFYELDGRRISHTIDPRTGSPVTHPLASVTVVDEECMRADGLATALAVLGPQAGYEFARRHDIAALLLIRTPAGFEERVTPAFERLLE